MLQVAAFLAPLVLLAACSAADDQVVVEREVVVEQPAAQQVVETPPPEVIEQHTRLVTDTPAPTPPAPPPPDIPLHYLIGDVDPASDPTFARIPQKYLGGSRVWGHAEAVDALVAMGDAAAADGISLKAVSAFRSFSDQRRIWNDKWNGATRVDGGRLPDTHPDPAARARKILEMSSMPATSRHHWGTDFDLNDLNNSYFASGEGKRVYDWLQANAASYGFCQTYTAKGPDRPHGYEEERWHWSYMPVASRYLAAYPHVVGYDHITGFDGAETARDIGVIANYVEGINPACKG